MLAHIVDAESTVNHCYHGYTDVHKTYDKNHTILPHTYPGHHYVFLVLRNYDQVAKTTWQFNYIICRTTNPLEKWAQVWYSTP